MLKTISAVPTLQVVGAYVAGDNMGGLLTYSIGTSSVASKAASCTIRRIVIIDADIEDAEVLLHVFSDTPTATVTTDADACAPAAADLLLKLATIHVAAADYMDSTGDSIVTNELDIPINFDGEDLYCSLECVGTPTYTAADDLIVTLVVEV